jgi:hypothetical protein
MTEEASELTGTSRDRQYLPTLAELVDRLSIDQIRTVLLSENRESHEEEIRRLEYDLDTIIQERGLKLSGKVLRVVVVLAQMNLHIWNCKEKMDAEPDRYHEWLKLAHQLNGIRNQMKNMLMEESADQGASVRHTNVQTDELQGWDVQIG